MPEEQTKPTPPSDAFVAPAADEGQSTWNRRRFITFGISVAAGVIACLWSPISRKLASWFSRPNAPRHNNPYYLRRKTSTVFATVKLNEGFYAREKSPTSPPRGAKTSQLQNRGKGRKRVIQYVDSAHRVPFLAEINEQKLRDAPADFLETADFLKTTDSLHVSFARASALFELAALERIKAGEHERACDFLIAGIRHDLAYKRGVRRPPSMRLHDMLARVSVRHDSQKHFEMLLELENDTRKLIESLPIGLPAKRNQKTGKRRSQSSANAEPRSRRREGLEKRIAKWKSEEWKARIAKEKQIWTLTVAPDTTRNRNVKRTFEL
jgi:hypothetical protein